MFEKRNIENKNLNQYLNELYVNLKNNKRDDVFVDAFPPNFLYYNLKSNQLEEPNQDKIFFEIDQKRVSQLILLVEVVESEVQDSINAVLAIKFLDGAREFITIPVPDVKKLQNLFVENGAVKEKMFSRKSEKSKSWDKHTVESIYQAQSVNPEIYYDKLYNEIIHLIIRKLKIGSPVIIVDGGCGDKGALLFKIEEELKANNIANNVKLMGFDFNNANIQKCEEVRSSYPDTNCIFLQGDLTLTNDVINTWRDKSTIDKDTPIILTLSGSLTRLVLKDGFQGLEALKSIALQGHIEYLIGGGVGEPLMNSFVMKQVGYKKIAIKSDVSNFFYYAKMSDEEILHHRLKKLNKYSMIDLSLCPDPDKLLGQLQKFLPQTNQPVTIDLSFTGLTDSLIDNLKEYAKKNSNVSLIFWHNDPGQILKFYHSFMKEDGVKNISVSSLKWIEDDGYLMSSRLFISALHGQSGILNSNVSEEDASIKNIQLHMIKMMDLNIVNQQFAAFLILIYSSNWVNKVSNESVIDELLEQIKLLKYIYENRRVMFFNKQDNVTKDMLVKKSLFYNICRYEGVNSIEGLDVDEYDNTLFIRSEVYQIDEQIHAMISSFIVSLEKKIFEENDIKFLPNLIVMYQQGVIVKYDTKYSSDVMCISGKSLVKEIELYDRLASHPFYAQSFGAALMKRFAQHRILEYKPDWLERNSVDLDNAKVRMLELFGATHGNKLRLI